MHIQKLAPVAVLMLLGGCGQHDKAPTSSGALSKSGGPEAEATTAAEKQAEQAAANPSWSGFEGELGLLAKSSSSNGPPKAIAVLVKGTKLRFDMPEGIGPSVRFGKSVHVVMNTSEKRVFAVLDEKKQVVVVNLETLSEQMKGLRPPGAPPEPENTAPAKMTKTGHSDTVAGRSCEDWEVVSAKSDKLVVCVANEGAAWFQLPTIGLPTEHAWARELFDGHHLPLRMIGYDKAGTESARLEITKLEKKDIADSQFEIPAGYKTLDVAEMMKGFMAGPMPPGMAMPPGMPPGAHVPPNMQEMIKRMREQMQAKGAKPAKAKPAKTAN